MIEITEHNEIFMDHPDGGHCNLMGMSSDSYED